MIDRLEERQAIAAKLAALDEAEKAARNAPEVIEARSRKEAARVAYRAAEDEYMRLWRAAEARLTDSISSIAKQHPDMVIAGKNDGYPYPVLCAATGLPLLMGDRVVAKDATPDDYHRSVVLFGAVDVKSAGVPINTITIEPEAEEVEEEDDEEAVETA